MYGLVLTAIWKPIVVDLGFFHVNVMTLAILGVYIINVKNMNDDSSNAAEDEGSAVALSVGQILFRFASYSVALVIVSILLTYVTDTIAQELQLGTTVAGAIFLGVATSLPELSASINLVRIGNTTMRPSAILSEAICLILRFYALLTFCMLHKVFIHMKRRC